MRGTRTVRVDMAVRWSEREERASETERDERVEQWRGGGEEERGARIAYLPVYLSACSRAARAKSTSYTSELARVYTTVSSVRLPSLPRVCVAYCVRAHA